MAKFELILLKDKEEIAKMSLSAELFSSSRIRYNEESFTIKINDDSSAVRMLLELFLELWQEVDM